MAESNLTTLVTYIDLLIQISDRLTKVEADEEFSNLAEHMAAIYAHRLREDSKGKAWRYACMLGNDKDERFHDFVLLLQRADEFVRRQAELQLLQDALEKAEGVKRQLEAIVQNLEMLEQMADSLDLTGNKDFLVTAISRQTTAIQQQNQDIETKDAELVTFLKDHVVAADLVHFLRTEEFATEITLSSMEICSYTGAYAIASNALEKSSAEILTTLSKLQPPALSQPGEKEGEG